MITKDTSIMEVLQAEPESREVFVKHGMHCMGCFGSEFESIEMGARSHEINLEVLLAELNEVIRRKNK